MTVPAYSQFMNPLLGAMHELGGSGTIDEIDAKAISIMRLTKQQIETLHNPETSSRTEVEYRLAWARTYLKRYGLLENSSRGVWALTTEGSKAQEVDPHEMYRSVRKSFLDSANSLDDMDKSNRIDSIELSQSESWEEKLRAILFSIDASAFERLTQRLLRESGFIKVEVTGRVGDGGIDGRGILQIGGLVNFRVLFQCKRYKGSVAAREIREFQAATLGRADRGLFVTTGHFTRDAQKEASRDGAPPIDLIDGDRFIQKLKELSLGIQVKLVEEVSVDETFFQGI